MPNSSTKQLVQIADIRENVVFLPSGSLRSVLEVSSINFELRSEDEQNAILQNFQQFLNSIDFPLQIVLDSRRFDINEYLAYVQQATGSLTNELLKIQAAEYTKFIRELADLANIMSKKFYIVIPFYISETPGTKGLLNSITGIFKSKKGASLTEEQFQTYKNQLAQRTEVVLDGLVSLSLHAQILEEEVLKNLFVALHNPGVKNNA